MAIVYSSPAGPDRRLLRRQQTIEEALDAAVAIMEEAGVGGLSMSEIARRLGMRQPSLYKYFPSLHAVYDALFARGVERTSAAVQAAVADVPRGVASIRAAGRALVRWAVENPVLAQLLYWRPVPGFAPTATFAPSVRLMDQLRAAFAAAVQAGALHPRAASEEAPRLFTVVLSGLISQQMANEPGAGYDTGIFTGLTDAALEMFFARYARAGAGASPETAPRPQAAHRPNRREDR
ncbi:MAG: TetR/AcrR family transcriptional regulator [Streptosporangiaceae bacterium]|nr:TetR/AcrR family transcriptional regulator [Streptosporangiaceae bacterium]